MLYAQAQLPLLLTMRSELAQYLQRYRLLAAENDTRRDAVLAEHRRIFEAIAQRDVEAAKLAAAWHLQNAKQFVLASI